MRLLLLNDAAPVLPGENIKFQGDNLIVISDSILVIERSIFYVQIRISSSVGALIYTENFQRR